MARTVELGATAAEVAWWWGASLGVWLLSLSTVSGSELLVATPASFLCGLLAVVARRAMRAAWRPSPGDLPPLGRALPAIFADAAAVVLAALRRRPGGFRTLELTGGRGDGARPAARRAVATFVLSLAPGTYVVDLDPADGRALVHELDRRGAGVGEGLAR